MCAERQSPKVTGETHALYLSLKVSDMEVSAMKGLSRVSAEIVALQAELVLLEARAQDIRARLSWLRLLRAALTVSARRGSG